VWLFRRQPEDQQFTIPLATLDAVTVTAPPITDKRRVIEIQAGAKALDLPYEADQTEINGQKWTRISIKLLVAPRVAGKTQVPPATVAAAFATSRADFFGNVSTKLFRTSDTEHALEVKPLPETDRPGSFAGAVGSQFAISVATSRSVVQLGEPVELAITVKSDQRLDTLALGRLDGDGGLPKDKFTVPAEPPTGELSDDGKAKTFKVTAQVTGPATEIPALAFSYFDPVKSAYQTVHSDPIALSVKGGSVVGAADVIAATPAKRSAAPAESDVALVGADLALSSPGDVGDRPLGGILLGVLVGLLYAIPLGVFAFRIWQLRTRGQRVEAAEVRAARKALDDILAKAEREPARDTAGAVVAALRTLARTLERDVGDTALIARLETESFAPSAAASPLPAELRTRVAELARSWTARRTKRSSSAAIVLVVAASLVAHRAEASDALANGRSAYQQAMSLTDASLRKAAFARAAVELAEAARVEPDRPELLADWGNAALGAGDVGTATLAFRRALAIDPGNSRARRNLAWLRSRQADTLRPAAGGAADTLFFFHDWPRARRLVVGAFAFALVVLLLVPWTGKRRRGLALVALLPAAVWIAMLVSVVLEDHHGDDAVVMDASVLRAADSAGAPAALAQPLPRGTEVTVLERRDTWMKVRTASGTAGWVPDGSVELVNR
jgi:hypothetical protein